MGNDTINQAADGTPIPAANHNSIRGALSVDHVPRNSSGVVTDQAGSIGSTTYTWLKSYIRKMFLGDPTSLNSIEEDSSNDIVIKRNNIEKLKIQSTGINASYLVDNSITAAKVQDNTLTQLTMFKRSFAGSTASLGNVAVSATVSSYTLTSTSEIAIPNLSVTLTTTGRPVWIMLVSETSISSTSYVALSSTSTGAQDASAYIYVKRGASYRASQYVYGQTADNNSTPIAKYIKSEIQTIDPPTTAGTYTYTIAGKVGDASDEVKFVNVRMLAFEI